VKLCHDLTAQRKIFPYLDRNFSHIISTVVDTQAVAAALDYKNHRSVGNKVSVLKKRYNLPFGSTAKTTNAAAAEANSAIHPFSPNPMTPTKNKVTKPKTPASKRKTPVKNKAKKVESDDDEEPISKQEDSSEEEKKEMEKIKMDQDLEDEKLFGVSVDAFEDMNEDTTA